MPGILANTIVVEQVGREAAEALQRIGRAHPEASCVLQIGSKSWQ